MVNTLVSLDLETTGLDPQQDEIIEVAAVKFRGPEVVDTFHSLVNPGRPLPLSIQALTGIRPADLQGAPSFQAMAPSLASFLGSCPLVGHRLSFDLGFLKARGFPLPREGHDTWELSTILLPGRSDYSLASLAQGLGFSQRPCHRALPDALGARELFLYLQDRARNLPATVFSELRRLSLFTPWQEFFAGLKEHEASPGPFPIASILPLTPAEEKTLKPARERKALNGEELAACFVDGGPLSRFFPGYEQRPEQVQMLQAVAEALNQGEHLIVEAGTGTGKSLAYLLPAALFALRNGVPVVLSTHTISLQEQLLKKDLPQLLRALALEVPELSSLRTALLKGRENYLCLRRWLALLRSPGLSLEEVKFLLRTLVWLAEKGSGDRGEVNLPASEAVLWNRVAAEGESCLSWHCLHQQQGHCFLHRARRAAQASHLVVTNHALLLTDALGGSQVLPDFQHLILDEAHHLEEVATERLGFRLSSGKMVEHLNRLQAEGRGGGGLLPQVQALLPLLDLSASRRGSLEKEAGEAAEAVGRARGYVNEFYQRLRLFLEGRVEETGDYERRLRINRLVRAQPAWSGVEETWDNLGATLAALEAALGRLAAALEGLEGVPEEVRVDLTAAIAHIYELRRQGEDWVVSPDEDSIYWAALDKWSTVLHAAPRNVSPYLEKALFSPKGSVILTGATLSTEGTFRYLRKRLGLEGGRELLLGTPFDYYHSAVIYLAQDLPEPAQSSYQKAVEVALLGLCQAAEGRTLVLFTSHAALRETYANLRGPLEDQGLLLLAQGIDGSPRQLLSSFKNNPRRVLFGAASFWEGVDVVGDALSLLVIARLPFSVPTDPVFAARAEDFEDPFQQYALPQAVLRFKQGFGRLIRSKADRGALVVLDRRLTSKAYGAAFLDSLPPCPLKALPWREMGREVKAWLGPVE